MDFEKIIRQSLTEVNEEFGDNPRLQFMVSESEKECIVPHKMLLTYSENLLKNYHSELLKLLHNKGIDL